MPVDYDAEFDKLVGEYNGWLSSLRDPKIHIRNLWNGFLRGIASPLEFGYSRDFSRIHSNPLDSSQLSPWQRDAIALASDWQRVDNTLDKIIGDQSTSEVSVLDAKARKSFVHQIYEGYRQAYVKDKAHNF